MARLNIKGRELGNIRWAKYIPCMALIYRFQGSKI